MKAVMCPRLKLREIHAFENWLLKNGFYLYGRGYGELLRFKGASTGVVYDKGCVKDAYTARVISAYHRVNSGYVDTDRVHKRLTTYKPQRQKLLNRDGRECLYCGCDLVDDVSVEHLVPLAHGGTNDLSNLILVHGSCNKLMGSKTLAEKLKTALIWRDLISGK